MTDNVQVAVRVRPFNERERNLESASCIRKAVCHFGATRFCYLPMMVGAGMMKETQQTIIVDPETNAEKVFTFDYRYWCNCCRWKQSALCRCSPILCHIGYSYNSFVQTDDPEFASQDVVWNDIGLKV